MRGIILLSILSVLGASCSETPLPKPHGYPRIELHDQVYEQWDGGCPYMFKKSTSANIQVNPRGGHCFFDLKYPRYNATVHLSYSGIQNDLKELIDQEYQMREKHNNFATSVMERLYSDPINHVNALIFNINGTKTATPLQFFVTDSINHFFRGTLYFYNTPNNDSLAPVIDLLKEDMDTMIATLRWKE